MRITERQAWVLGFERDRFDGHLYLRWNWLCPAIKREFDIK